jgi:hypothetical protein
MLDQSSPHSSDDRCFITKFAAIADDVAHGIIIVLEQRAGTLRLYPLTLIP